MFGRRAPAETTTLDAIAGCARRSARSIAIGGRVLYSSDARVNVPPHQRHVGYVPAGRRALPHARSPQSPTARTPARRLQIDRVLAMLEIDADRSPRHGAVGRRAAQAARAHVGAVAPAARRAARGRGRAAAAPHVPFAACATRYGSRFCRLARSRRDRGARGSRRADREWSRDRRRSSPKTRPATRAKPVNRMRLSRIAGGLGDQEDFGSEDSLDLLSSYDARVTELQED